MLRKWCRQILAALGHIHAQQKPGGGGGGAHGDLRLSNIFVNGETGDILLGHFRLASSTLDEDSLKRALRYAAPEALDDIGESCAGRRPGSGARVCVCKVQLADDSTL